MSSIVTELEKRGVLHSVTDREGIEAALQEGGLTFYCGFDPTADSLHVGNLLPLIVMRWLAKAGCSPIILLGGATGMIGDPSGRSSERNLLSLEQIQKNLDGIAPQVKKVVGEGAAIVSNSEWLLKVPLLEFLRDIGKHFSVNAMLQRDSVRTRIESRDEGISYTEFSYMLLQAYDFLWLYENKQCRLQIGGSDQWGNIVSGADLIRRKHPDGPQAFGLTNNLLTTSSGTKFGKTAAGAVWLDSKRTSPYAFYQYWVNTEDADVERYLKYFTDLSLEEIAALMTEHSAAPEKRIAQKRLAAEVTILVHGSEELRQAENATAALFGGDFRELPLQVLEEAFHGTPSIDIERHRLEEGIPVSDLLVLMGASKSKSEARRLIEGGGCSLNGEKIQSVSAIISSSSLLHEKLLIVRSGKRSYFIAHVN